MFCQAGHRKEVAFMSVEFAFRLLGMVILAVGGVYWGVGLAGMGGAPRDLWAVIFGLVGALIGLVVTPFVTTRPARALRALIMQVSASALVAAMIGLTVGLLVAVLVAFPLSLLPIPLGQILPLVGALVFAWLGITIFVMRQRDIFSSSGGACPAGWPPRARAPAMRGAACCSTPASSLTAGSQISPAPASSPG